MARLEVYQSLWAMERRHPDGGEYALEEAIAMIHGAGFDGVSASFESRPAAARLAALLKPLGLGAEAQCFPATLDDLKPTLENAVEFGAHHIGLQPNLRPRRQAEALAMIDGWVRLAEEAGVLLCIETHRNRMTNDLPFTLDLLEARPDLVLLADISHYVVGREIELPVTAEHEAMMRQILVHAGALHGRVASSEQVQIEISFAHHQPWVQQFLAWWGYAFAAWKRRAGPEQSLVFTCELGPRPYAIVTQAGDDSTDRWAEALMMKEWVRTLWQGVA